MKYKYSQMSVIDIMNIIFFFLKLIALNFIVT